MIKGTATIMAVASVAVAAILAAVGRPPVPDQPAPGTYPVCSAEDGGPVPCVLDGPRYRQPGDRGPVVTITERP